MNKISQGFVSVSEILDYLAQDRYLSMSEAAAYTGLSERTLRSRLQEIPRYRPGGKLLFRKSELDEWMLRYRECENSIDLGRLADEVLEGIL